MLHTSWGQWTELPKEGFEGWCQGPQLPTADLPGRRSTTTWQSIPGSMTSGRGSKRLILHQWVRKELKSVCPLWGKGMVHLWQGNLRAWKRVVGSMPRRTTDWVSYAHHCCLVRPLTTPSHRFLTSQIKGWTFAAIFSSKRVFESRFQQRG